MSRVSRRLKFWLAQVFTCAFYL